MLKTFTSAAALTALMAGGAMAQDDTMIMADDAMQMSMMDGQTNVTFPRIAAREDGYIVLHAVQDGEPVVPESLAHAMIMAGENENVTVTIPEALAAGTELVAMLHVESNGNGVYDFGPGMTDVDTPVMANGAPVTAMFTVPEGMEMEMTDTATSPDVASPEARAESDDADDPDYRDDNENAIQPNDLDTEGFIEEGEDSDSEGDEDDGQ